MGKSMALFCFVFDGSLTFVQKFICFFFECIFFCFVMNNPNNQDEEVHQLKSKD